MRLYMLFSIALLAASCSGVANTPNSRSAGNGNSTNVSNTKAAALPVYTYDVVKSYPHDPNAFTQGLVFHDGFLYESTGELGESSLRKVELETGKVVRKFDLSRDIFAEGITILNDKIYQLSWQNQTAWEYQLSDFKMLREFRYPGQGWGLTDDGTNLFMTDRTHVMRVLNPENFEAVRTIVVKDEAGQPLMKLNELEYIKGEIWANIWHSEEIGKPNHIARIDPATGKLLGWIDLGNISPDDQNGPDKIENSLNGIAYDEAGDRIFVTGKNWKKLFEIKVRPK